MNKSTVKGYLGELYVKRKIESEIKGTSWKIEHRGNQSGFDLLLNENIRIDVKLSTLKCEFNKKIMHWGWALQFDRTENIKWDYAICVALNKKYVPGSYYIINHNDCEDFPRGPGQFKNVSHGFGLLLNKLEQQAAPQNWQDFFQRSYKLLEKGKAKIIATTNHLSKHLT